MVVVFVCCCCGGGGECVFVYHVFICLCCVFVSFCPDMASWRVVYCHFRLLVSWSISGFVGFGCVGFMFYCCKLILLQEEV